MEATKPAVSALLLLLCGCKAEVTQQPDAALHDLAVDGGEPADLSGADFTVLPDLECAVGPEICGNGCDDDRNGYSDDDDPACTPQVMVTFPMGGPQTLQRLVLTPPYVGGIVDGNAVTSTSRGVYVRAFAPGVAFVVNEDAAYNLERITLPPPGSMGKGTVTNIPLTYLSRDVCVFHNELIVLEHTRLHRVQSDGVTENGTVQLPAWTAADTYLAACASDGKYLYVAEHFGAQRSQFEILDDTFMPVASPSPGPEGLFGVGIDRCVDFAWTRSGFYGLFARSGGTPQDSMNSGELHSFALGGDAGPPIDAGALHSLGEFQP